MAVVLRHGCVKWQTGAGLKVEAGWRLGREENKNVRVEWRYNARNNIYIGRRDLMDKGRRGMGMTRAESGGEGLKPQLTFKGKSQVGLRNSVPGIELQKSKIGAGTLRWEKRRRKKPVDGEEKDEEQKRWEGLMGRLVTIEREERNRDAEGVEQGEGLSVVGEMERLYDKGLLFRKDIVGAIVRFKQLQRWNAVLKILEWLKGREWWEMSEIDYGMLVTAAARSGCFDLAASAFDECRLAGFTPNVILCTAHIENLARSGNISRAEDVLRTMEQSGPSPTLTTYHTLLKAYSKAGMVEAAEDLFAKLEAESGMVVEEEDNYEAVEEEEAVEEGDEEEGEEAEQAATSVQENGRLGTAEDGHELNEMPGLDREKKSSSEQGSVDDVGSQGARAEVGEELNGDVSRREEVEDEDGGPLKLDARLFNVMIEMYSREGRPEDASRMYRKMKALGVKPTVVTFNTLIALFARDARSRQAEGVLKQMQAAGLRPDVYTYTSLLTAYGRSGRAEEAQAVFRDMVRCRIRPTSESYTSLINAYGRAGQVHHAEFVFKEMRLLKVKQTMEAVTALVGAYCTDRAFDKAESMIGRMQREVGVRASAGTYNVLMNALSREGSLKDVIRIFEKMLSTGVAPDVGSYTILIKAHSRVGDFNGAILTFQEMVDEAGLTPNQGVRSALLAACESLESDGEGEDVDEEEVRRRREEVMELLGKHFGEERTLEWGEVAGERKGVVLV